ncbi:BREX-1 system phosphatase PglZ type A [Paracoccaceae bacterium]|nr:BREX-1 system phosphatase PglZ type A [Paracoccaceae bacterium]
MDERIVQGLKSHFEKHRIVFWYDSKKEMREQFDNLEIDDVEKIEIDNNEFSIKHRILREHPKQKFLIYKFGSEPEKLTDNWLLDVQLSHGQFRTDQIQMWLNELSLDLGFASTIEHHQYFFRSKKRIEDLKSVLTTKDDTIALKGKMLLVSTGSKQDMEGIVASLFGDLAKSDDKIFKLLKKCNLDEFLWEQLERRYGYAVENPTIADFALELFKSCYQRSQNQESMLNAEAHILLQRWKNDRNNKDTFEQLSGEFQAALLVSDDTEEKDIRSLIEVDYFEEIDRHIIRSLVRELSAQTLSRNDVQVFIRTRRKTHWFANYEHVYNSILYGSEFLHEISTISLGMDGFEDGLKIYTKTWFKIDQLYRKFIFHLKKSSQTTLLGDIGELIENKYGNDYLLRLNDVWQKQIDPLSDWKNTNVTSQREFYQTYVQNLRRKDTKCVVIISDALRYEVGEELQRKIREKDKFDAKIDPLLASLPSFTQLGMASLLPMGDLGIPDPSKPTVTHTGVSTAGIDNRKKVLGANIGEDRSSAWHADDFLDFKTNEIRDIIRDHDVVFIYHNRIDATGDSVKTEEKVFESVEDTIEELVLLVRKLTSANAGHIFITSDHGFIYQNRDLDPSDYLGSKPEGQEILYNDRRFVLGKKLSETSSFKKFTSSQLGISGDFEVLFPKSINRLRRSGSGAKFVHGGVSLQEVVIPVLSITKGRQSDAEAVEVTIITGSSKTISTSQISVKLYQEKSVSSKTHARTLRIGLYGGDGQLLSDQQEVSFDIESENARDREQKVQVLLSKRADEYNNMDVILRLDEQHPGTSHYKEYRSVKYMIRRTFTNDFDF